MSDLLLEIGLEEVPAKFMPPALAELKQMAETQLNEQRISYDEVVTYGTPRRIALVVPVSCPKKSDTPSEAPLISDCTGVMNMPAKVSGMVAIPPVVALYIMMPTSSSASPPAHGRKGF